MRSLLAWAVALKELAFWVPWFLALVFASVLAAMRGVPTQRRLEDAIADGGVLEKEHNIPPALRLKIFELVGRARFVERAAYVVVGLILAVLLEGVHEVRARAGSRIAIVMCLVALLLAMILAVNQGLDFRKRGSTGRIRLEGVEYRLGETAIGDVLEVVVFVALIAAVHFAAD